MKFTVLACLTLVVFCAAADTPNAAFEIWPQGKIPFALENPKPEGVEPMKDDVMRLGNVSVPQVVVTPVVGAAKPTPAVVICPGGGYWILAWNHEGVEVAQWLKDNGVAGVILKYRVPDQRKAALADALRAVRWVRANAAKFNIDPDAVGILGFSAGANLAVATATNWKRAVYAPVDDVDKQSCRPDFQLPIYPWDLLPRKDAKDAWKGHEGLTIRAEDYPVDKDTPKAFMVQSEDDFCQIETSLAYCAALKKAGVGVELHVYEKGGHGGHGYGVRKLGFPTDGWTALAVKWLEQFKK